MIDQALIEELVRRLSSLEERLEEVMNTRNLFEILNHRDAEDVISDQTAYNPGNYDTVILNPTAARTIRGIAGGTPGRMLWIRNRSTLDIVTGKQIGRAHV